MRKIDKFTNMYSLSKTLRFELKPVGKTLENFQKKNILEDDDKKDKAYVRVKKIIDKYHKIFISKVLLKLKLNGLNEYSDLYLKKSRTEKDEKDLEEQSKSLRKQISSAFKNDEEYKSIFGKEMIETILPNFSDLTEDEKEDVKLFSKFSTYFQGFYKNRENMYSGDGKSTEIAYRIIDQNLPKFLDNIKASKYVFDNLPEENIKQIEKDFFNQLNVELKDMFSIDYYNFCLSQEEIDIYNQVIGGIKLEDKQIKGLNSYINEYNQNHQQDQKPIPKFSTLYKQILSDRTTLSFVIDKYGNEDDMLNSIKEFYFGTQETESAYKSISALNDVISSISSTDTSGIYISSNSINDASLAITGEWNTFINSLYTQYDNTNGKKETEKYYAKREKAFKSVKSYSLSVIQSALDESDINCKITDRIQEITLNGYKNIHLTLDAAEEILNSPYPKSKNIHQEDHDIETIKEFLDSVLNQYRFLNLFSGSGIENDKNQNFYADYSEKMLVLSGIVKLYNKVRNFITQKPYYSDKFRLNFSNPQFLGGWDIDKVASYSSTILKKGNAYYLCILDNNNRNLFKKSTQIKEGEEYYEKMRYIFKSKPPADLAKTFFTRKGKSNYPPSLEIERIHDSKSYAKGETFSIEDCHKFIDYYKQRIKQDPKWSQFKFKFSQTDSYANVGEFFREVAEGAYSVTFEKISEKWLEKNINEGNLYLFQIYNKDFSRYSKGTPNLHTMYFKALFDPENAKKITYKLSGGAEMFYRRKGISYKKPTHPASLPVKNKNPHTEKDSSLFTYDLIKDKRYTEDKFSLHLPIEINFKSKENEYLNSDVRYELRNSDHNYVIGIDRGERHLLYVCVIDSQGMIVEQFSLNTIENEYSGKIHTTDYHQLLSQRESDRTSERRNWKSVENIKELKQGYLSQAVSKICDLVEKYDAIVVMENLNAGFKNSRIKIEKQVYQKFENMLIEKLRYRVKKTRDINEPGGLYNALQLTNSSKYSDEKFTQNGFVFYIPAWNTSKIDPTTGFVNMLSTRYESVEKSKSFIKKFESISYNKRENVFEFAINYDNFKPVNSDYIKEWTLTTYGERIETQKTKEGIYRSNVVNITEKTKELLLEYNINLESGIKEAILEIDDAKFFKQFMWCIKLMLQMRNSETGGEVDYLISPVKNKDGKHYCSNDYVGKEAIMPQNADANGAYNIALKGLWAINKIKESPEDKFEKVSIGITNKEWLEFVQKRSL